MQTEYTAAPHWPRYGVPHCLWLTAQTLDYLHLLLIEFLYLCLNPITLPMGQQRHEIISLTSSSNLYHTYSY
jgi:hypothetical protein